MNINIKLLITGLFFLTSQASFGKDLFHPYLQIGGTRFFNTKHSSTAASYDFFMPIWQTPDKLVFTDIRLYDRSGKSFEGNFHLGYRQLSADNQQLFGIYGAFDRKKTDFNNCFNQLTLGVEYRFNKLFIGMNFYQPIGKKERQAGGDAKYIYKNTLVTNKSYEKPLPGVDGELGYELAKGLTGYVGGYYFKARGTKTVFGPKASLSYDLSSDGGKKVLGIFDKVGFEAGIQHDKQRGNVGYVGLNFRIGASSNKQEKLEGVARHMVDLIRRDVDIVTGLSSKEEKTIIKDTNVILDDRALIVKDSENSLPADDNSSSQLTLTDNQYETYANSSAMVVYREPIKFEESLNIPTLDLYQMRGNLDANLSTKEIEGNKSVALITYNPGIELQSANQDNGVSGIPNDYYAANLGAMVVYREPIKFEESSYISVLNLLRLKGDTNDSWVTNKIEDKSSALTVYSQDGGWLSSAKSSNGDVTVIPDAYYTNNSSAIAVYRGGIDDTIVDSYSHINLIVRDSKKLNNETITDDEIAETVRRSV